MLFPPALTWTRTYVDKEKDKNKDLNKEKYKDKDLDKEKDKDKDLDKDKTN